MESGLEARIQRLKSKGSASTSELVFLQKMLTKHKRRQADSWMQQQKLQLKKRLQRLREDVRTECDDSGEWTDFEFNRDHIILMTARPSIKDSFLRGIKDNAAKIKSLLEIYQKPWSYLMRPTC